MSVSISSVFSLTIIVAILYFILKQKFSILEKPLLELRRHKFFKLKCLEDDNKINESILRKEFEQLTQFSFKFMNSARDYGDARNLLDRYTNIFSDGYYDKTRVRILKNDGDDYINANYVRGENSKFKFYIATQGPLPETIGHFWKMVYQQNVACIVSLVSMKEVSNGKCEAYWPEKMNQTNQYRDMFVMKIEEHEYEDYIVRVVHVWTENETAVKMVTMFHYLKWNDHLTPKSEESLINLMFTAQQDLGELEHLLQLKNFYSNSRKKSPLTYSELFWI